MEVTPRSPAIQTRILEHKIDLENKADENQWKSCCVVMDKRAITFFSQIFTTVSIMTFCMVQLVRLDDCNSEQTYLGLLTFLIGCMLPNPQFNKQE